MRLKLLPILLFLFIAFSVKAQQGTFLKVFTGQSYEEGIKSFRLPNKTYRIVGNTGTYGWGQKNIWLIALDSSGNFMWHKTYGEGGLDYAEDAQMDSQGNIFIIGSSTSETVNSYQMLLAGIDTNGHAFTYTYFGGANWDFGNGIQIINDSTVILVGETYSYGNGQSNAWILKALTNGQQIWMSTIGGNDKDGFYSVKQLPDSSFICAGYSNSYGNGSKNAMLHCCSATGDSIWTATYTDTTDGEFFDLIVNSDTNIIAVGYQMDSSSIYRDISLMNFDVDGQLIWTRPYLRHHQEADYKSIIAEGNNYIISGMSTKYSSGKEDIYGSRLDKDGWWANSFVFGSSEDDYSNSITRDTSNGQLHYIVTGTTRSYGLNFSGAIFVRMDSNFQADTVPSIFIPSGMSSSENLQQIPLKIYPNPTSDFANIVIPAYFINEPIQVYIYNMLGEVFLQSTIEKGQKSLRLDIRNWPNASYFIVLKTTSLNCKGILIKK